MFNVCYYYALSLCTAAVLITFRFGFARCSNILLFLRIDTNISLFAFCLKMLIIVQFGWRIRCSLLCQLYELLTVNGYYDSYLLVLRCFVYGITIILCKLHFYFFFVILFLLSLRKKKRFRLNFRSICQNQKQTACFSFVFLYFKVRVWREYLRRELFQGKWSQFCLSKHLMLNVSRRVNGSCFNNYFHQRKFIIQVLIEHHTFSKILHFKSQIEQQHQYALTQTGRNLPTFSRVY